MHPCRFLLALGLAAMLSACAAPPRATAEFPVPRPGDLQLGVTTAEQARQMFGKAVLDMTRPATDLAGPNPDAIENPRPAHFRPVAESGQITDMMYIQVPPQPRRLMLLKFWNDRLVEHVLLVDGTFEPGFLREPSSADWIVRGRTRETDVRARLGVPLAESIYPRIGVRGGRMLGYLGTAFDDADGQRRGRFLFVMLDERGIVTDYALQLNTIRRVGPGSRDRSPGLQG